jgi:hypothetical protein
MFRLKVLFAAVAACLLAATSVQAQVEDPQAQIGPNPPPSGTPPFPGDVNKVGSVSGTNTIGAGGFTLFPNGMKNGATTQPMLIILGIPNATSTNITGGTVTYNNGATSETMTLLTGTSNTVKIGGVTYGPFGATSMTAVPKNQDAYADLGLPTAAFGGNSESWKNWSTFDPTATSFGLFVFEIPDKTGGLNGNGASTYAEISLNNNMADGTFVIAFGANDKGGANTDKNLNLGTPFTQAGWNGSSPPPVPEPSSMILGAFGLIGLGFTQVRRLVRRKALALA